MKRTKITLLSLILALGFLGCGKEQPVEPGFHYAAPTELTGESEYHAVSLTWKAVEGADFYVIYYGEDANLQGTTASQGNSGEILTSEPSIRINLFRGIDHYFSVAAGGSLGKLSESELSEAIIVKPGKIPPNAEKKEEHEENPID